MQSVPKLPAFDANPRWGVALTTMMIGGITLTTAAAVGVGFLAPCWRASCENSRTADWLGPAGLAASALSLAASVFALFWKAKGVNFVVELANGNSKSLPVSLSNVHHWWIFTD